MTRTKQIVFYKVIAKKKKKHMRTRIYVFF